MPVGGEDRGLAPGHGGAEEGGAGVVRGGRGARPEAGSDRGQFGGPPSRRFGLAGADHRNTQKIGLELHQKIISGGAAVDPQPPDADRRVPSGAFSAHHFKYVEGLQGDRFESGTDKMSA